VDPTNDQVQIHQSLIVETVDDDDGNDVQDAGVEGDNFITPPRNNKHQQCNTTINSDLVLGVKDGADNAGEAAANVKVRRPTPTIYKCTDWSAWTMHTVNEEGEVVGGWRIAPIPNTRWNNEFKVNRMVAEKNAMKDAD
jgi:hypothetical protein